MKPRILVVIEASEEIRAGLAMALAAIPDAEVDTIEIPVREQDPLEGAFGEITFRLTRWAAESFKGPPPHRPYPAHLHQPGWKFGGAL